MLSKIQEWIEDRWPVKEVWKIATEEEIPGGASYSYTFGSATLFLFLLQIVTGIWQIFYYVPTTDHAYMSLSYLRISVPFGWLIHGLHYWGATAMIVLLSAHLARVYIWGAYKKPRELTWLIGVLLLLFTMAMSFTGAALPWDETGYWASEVGTSIAGTTPILGSFAESLLRGGTTMGQLTLSRFFILHVAIIPAILLGIIALHLVAFRKKGSVGPWNEEKRKKAGWFWPDQVFKDAVVFSIILLVLIGLAAFLAPPFSGPADPLDTTFQPKPEWNFLFLYQAIKAFQGPWEPVGTIGIPTALFVFLFALPFVDKRKERNPRKRPLVMGLGFIIAAGVITLTITGYYSHPGVQATKAGNGKTVATAAPAETTKTVSNVQTGLPPLTPAQKKGAEEGKEVFASVGCTACHAVNGVGGKVGPDLSSEGLKAHSVAWLTDQIRNPKSHDPKTVMPPFTMLSTVQVNQLVDYLTSLRGAPAPSSAVITAAEAKPTPPPGVRTVQLPKDVGPPGLAANMIGNVKHGEILYNADCANCHGPEGKGGVQNPGTYLGVVPALNPVRPELFSKDPDVFADNLDRFIQNGSAPPGPKPSRVMAPMSMLGFGKTQSLTQPEIANIITYIMHLNGVDRAEIRHAGIAPKTFFWIVLGIFVLFWLILGMIRLVSSQGTTATSKDPDPK
ncbi:MAG: cytochrome b N-terminal domain-containing protein [Bacteroidetes bacterium]|nr:cytochrome b N-terminal domain-containing protein [Bacteroidota bacterium]